jgi:hypothetical protein
VTRLARLPYALGDLCNYSNLMYGTVCTKKCYFGLYDLYTKWRRDHYLGRFYLSNIFSFYWQTPNAYSIVEDIYIGQFA